MSEPEVLGGGNSNVVIKENNTVIRKMGAKSPFVHALLNHLATVGFNESPRLIETIGDQERLTYIEGEVGHYPLKAYMQSENTLVEAARLLRRLHDVTRDFAVATNTSFGHEVICHNDFAPYNCVFQAGHLVGIIDFDTAAAGKRVWDVAYAVYRFVPLTNDVHTLDCGWNPMPDRAARLKLFCDAYGLAPDDRAKLVGTVRQRLEALIHYMETNHSNLEHIPLYANDLRYIAANQQLFTDAINS